MERVQKSTDSSSLAEVVDRILDKGIVIDAWVKVSLVGIELITTEGRVFRCREGQDLPTRAPGYIEDRFQFFDAVADSQM